MATGNVATWVLQSSTDHGARVALSDGSMEVSYANLPGEVERFAAALAAAGIGAGDTVAVCARDTVNTALALLGLWRCGAVAAPLSELSRPHELRQDLAHANAIACIVDVTTEPLVGQIRGEVPSLREVLSFGRAESGARAFSSLLDEAAAKPAPNAATRAPDQPSLLIYGRRDEANDRAIAHGPPSLQAGVEATLAMLDLQPTDVVITTFRFSTALGLWAGLLAPLRAGARVVLQPDQLRSEPLRALCLTEQPTVMWLTPSLYSQLARDAEELGWPPFLASARHALASGEALPDKLASRVKQYLGCELQVCFAISEVMQPLLLGPATDVVGACGQLVTGVSGRIVDELGRDSGTNEIGTLELRAPAHALGYWQQGKLVPLFSGDWLNTNDRFFRDEDGTYHYCGRVDDWFKVSGKWVAPFEIERVLGAHEGVWECAVIGATDEDGVLKPLAFVVPNVGYSGSDELAAELREHVKFHLAPYKYPRWIEFLRELPRGTTGKLLRYKLKPTKRRRAETFSP